MTFYARIAVILSVCIGASIFNPTSSHAQVEIGDGIIPVVALITGIPTTTTGVVVLVMLSTVDGFAGTTSSSSEDKKTAMQAKFLLQYLALNRQKIEQQLPMGAGGTVEDIAAIFEVAPEHRRLFGAMMRARRKELLALGFHVPKKEALEFVHAIKRDLARSFLKG